MYRYSLIRFVPDPGRGEYVNIGAIAGDEASDDWALRLLSNYRRAKAIDDRDALPVAMRLAASLEAHIDALDHLPGFRAVEAISTTFLERLSSEMSNVVQLSELTPVVATTAEEALDLVFEEQLLDPATRRFRFEKKHRAVARVRDAYRGHRIPYDAVFEAPLVSVGSYQDQFDFGVHNGAVVQLVRCWSFQLPGQQELAEEVKAWAWVVHALQEHGGRLAAGETHMEIRTSTPIFAVFIPPIEGAIAPAFDQARAAFDELKIGALDVDSADRVGIEAASRLHVPA